jgi:hypothetical protein
MVDRPPTRYSPHGTPLRRAGDDTGSGISYSTETLRARKLWWRIRDVIRWPVRQSH